MGTKESSVRNAYTYLVGFDLLDKPSEDYEELYEAIEKISSENFPCLDSTWLIVSTRNTKEIVDALKVHLHEGDKLLVTLCARGDSFGFNAKETEWIRIHTNIKKKETS